MSQDPPPYAPPLPPRSSSMASSLSSWSSREEYPRSSKPPRVNTVHLTPPSYSLSEAEQTHPYSGSTELDDPRSSSLQSLQPIESAGPNRRTLLLVYIHGFMGTETSFKSFPAHVHTLLTLSLADTHAVYTKIYPRYQSRKNVSYARDVFSNWLTPHESDTTDVVLLGHSLGGILAAEVVLLPTHRPGSRDLFHHRILGHIAFDTPFLGMHPGVVSTGIASLFRSNPQPTDQPVVGSGAASAPLSINPFEAQPTDPNYNPAYDNDVVMPTRKGKLDQAFYFFNKHGKDWKQAATAYVKSHLEFGGCLADYDGLKKRYRSFRPLEDIDDLTGKRSPSGKTIPRRRFVNYYTASTGRIKPQPLEDKDKLVLGETEGTEHQSSLEVSVDPAASSRASTPRISISEPIGQEVITNDVDHLQIGDTGTNSDAGSDDPEMQHLDPQAEPPSPTLSAEPQPTALDHPALETIDTTSTDPGSSTHSLTSPHDSISISTSLLDETSSLPPLPPPPTAPAAFDPTPYTTADPSTLKLAQKEHARLLKTYERSKKDYDRTVREREKHVAKLEKARQKKADKEAADALKRAAEEAKLSSHDKSERARLRKEEERLVKEKARMEGRQYIPPATTNQVDSSTTLTQTDLNTARAQQEAEAEAALIAEEERAIAAARAKGVNAQKLSSKKQKDKEKDKPPKKQRDRKFCTLPAKDPSTGVRDPTWIRVYMEGVDEVVAHTSLFFVSEAYAKLVGDTAERIEGWVREDASVRAVKEAQAWEMGGGRVD